MTGRKKFWLSVVVALLCGIATLFTLNRILFLAMESARTYANQELIRSRYHDALIVLAIVAFVFCLFVYIAWKNRKL
jgi:uncharacterized membrane protein YhaH (DUF805 family)